MQYPSNARLIRTMCSGRVDEIFIWRAFRLGAPVVLVSGCQFCVFRTVLTTDSGAKLPAVPEHGYQ